MQYNLLRIKTYNIYAIIDNYLGGNSMKKVLAVVLVLIMAFAFTTSALASETVSVTLGAMNYTNNDTQKGWASHGHEDSTNNIPFEIFLAASGISISLSKTPDPEFDFFQFILSSNDGGWWQSIDLSIPDFFKANESGEGGRLVIPFSAANGELAGTEGKVIIAYYDDDIATLGVTGASLIGVPKALAEEAGVPFTGVTTFIALAALALAASGTGAVVVSRKLKK